jgi:potassium/hydrogen antiporter
VFVAGLLLGDADVPFKGETRRFQGALASLAEVVVFVALGLTVEVAALGEDSAWVDGLLLALVLAFVARPLVALVLLLPAELRWGERLFVAWSGLKGAVPILLAAFALLGGVDEAERIYRIVFVVVAFSVVVQGSLVPLVARRFGVPMRIVGGPAEARPPLNGPTGAPRSS